MWTKNGENKHFKESERSGGDAGLRNPCLDATMHLYEKLCPSMRPSVCRSVPCYFRETNMAISDGRKSSNDIMNNDAMSDN